MCTKSYPLQFGIRAKRIRSRVHGAISREFNQQTSMDMSNRVYLLQERPIRQIYLHSITTSRLLNTSLAANLTQRQAGILWGTWARGEKKFFLTYRDKKLFLL